MTTRDHVTDPSPRHGASKTSIREKSTSDRKLRILFLITQMERAGAQKVMLAVAKGLPPSDYDVTVSTLYDKGGYVAEVGEETGLEVCDLGMKKEGEKNPVGKLWRVLCGCWRLFRLLRCRQTDILQTFSHYSNIIGPIVAWCAGTRVVVTSERMSLAHWSRHVRLANKFVSRSALVTHVVCVCEATRRECAAGARNPDKFRAIPNGIELARVPTVLAEEERAALGRELGIGDSRHVVTMAGRLHPQKGHRYLIEAVPEVVAKFPGTVFLVAGEGALRVEIEAQIARAGLQDSVRLLGVRRDLPRVLLLTDVFVLPSLWEGMPNVALEAMAARVPVVATDVDGTGEVVVHGETGLLVPPADSAALAEALCTVLGDEELRKRMGDAGRERVERCFQLSDTVRRFDDLYKSLAEKLA